MKYFSAVITILLLSATVVTAQEATVTPLRRVVELAVGESATVELHDSSKATVKLLKIDEKRDIFRDAVREARVTIEVNGESATIVSATYHLPQLIGGVQVDCPITRGYYSNTSRDMWGLGDGKDARFRLWPKGSPWIDPATFSYPPDQKWFASDSQMANDPTHVDAGEDPGNKRIYYHDGLDIGGVEGMLDILSSTDGLVVSKAGAYLEGHDPDSTPVRPRYDVIYILDDRGWYIRYSHMKSHETNVVLGERVHKGQKLGELGKEGASGGWAHFHYAITCRQPSGKWGTEEAYAYYWQSYRAKFDPAIIAVARPHLVASVGETITLDGSRSASFDGEIINYTWYHTDHSISSGPTATISFDTVGEYSEVIKVEDSKGNVDYDFAVINVFDPADPEIVPPTIHAAYAPTYGIRAGDPVTFAARVFRSKEGGETWDFGDGTGVLKTKSHPGDQHLPDGYATTVHRFSQPGYYIVTVTHKDEKGLTATDRLDVKVE